MSPRLDALWFVLTRRPGLLAWLMLLLWEIVAFRVVVASGIAPAGALDDLFVIALLLAVFLFSATWPLLVRIPALTVLGLLLVLFTFANACYVTFFDTFLNLDSYTLLGQAGGATASIQQVITLKIAIILGAVPLALLTLVVLHASARRARRGALPGLLALAAGLGLALTWPAFSHQTFLVAERNGVMNLARQWVKRMYLIHGVDTQARKAAMLDTLAQTYPFRIPNDSPSGKRKSFPLLQEYAGNPTPGTRSNVVIVLMESFRLYQSGIDGAKGDTFAPNLAKLAKESLYFSNFYANANQTVRAEMATLCSILPNFTGGQVYSAFPSLGARCLPEILGDAGYSTHWISSYRASYGKKKRFLAQHGVQKFHDSKEINKRKLLKPEIGWGPSDEDLADFAADVLDQAKEPFFAEITTLSNHHPFNYRYGIRLPAWI